MKNTKFYICPHCGNIVEMIQDVGVAPYCCGQKMDRLIPGTVEASHEKHIPTAQVRDGILEVNVGSVNHPMEEVHWIEWVQLVTDRGSARVYLNPGQAPKVSFPLAGEKPLAVYAYCNLHGLWKVDL